MKKILFILAVIAAVALTVGPSTASAYTLADVQADVTSDVDIELGTSPNYMTSTQQSSLTTSVQNDTALALTANTDGSDTTQKNIPCASPCAYSVINTSGTTSPSGTTSASTLGVSAGVCYIGLGLKKKGINATYHFGYMRGKEEVLCEGFYPVTLQVMACIYATPGDGKYPSWKSVSCAPIHRGVDDVKLTIKHGCDYTNGAEYTWRMATFVTMEYVGGMFNAAFYKSRKYTTFDCFP